ncbi:hypothetical protein B0H66DRAFT_268676 [Apodospora peruviana]|uniref:FAD-binding PCMH-type domain-containing protein n=1 Tax=Apodospora peruviana TaxID=516989 RepID=A0AAE0M572_9PEZI|nr:hypothetical protein B0H66DRAFT_268676 [Apodospora peruviana]
MAHLTIFLASVVALVPLATGFDFSHADTTLAGRDIGSSSSIAFGHTSRSALIRRDAPKCKVFPGDRNWPSDSEWLRFNSSLGGALLKPRPAAAVCYRSSPEYDAAACSFLLNNATRTNFFFDDPLTILTQWPQGNTCPLSANPTGNCTQGGFPTYVANATTVKHVQLAVNFARNNNIRLVIKNTGHDFFGRNTGAGALSIWTHNLKSFELLPQYSQPGGNYRGAAARVGSGLQIWEAFTHAAEHNVSLLAGSCLTVGAYGGYITGGGHSPLSSLYGLGVDQVLSLQVVTADGKVVTADATTNQDLYFALRGGGGSTYGVVTSAIVKAHPAINLTIAGFTFTLGRTNSPPGPNPTITSSETFWKGFNAVFKFGLPTADGGGYLWTNGIPAGNNSYLMQARVQLPGYTISQAANFTAPLITELNALGIPVVLDTAAITTAPYSGRVASAPGGGPPSSSRFASRLFPRHSWEDPILFNATMDAARKTVEAGYTFHGLNMAPTEKAGGFSPPAGVNPVWRKTIMHADVFDPTNYGTLTAAEADAAHQKLQSHMEAIRAATPGGGAYYNEADLQEPDWQTAFFGENYGKLLKIKRARDPTQVFWAPGTVGSEGWAVQGQEQSGLPTQNGRLCRV